MQEDPHQELVIKCKRTLIKLVQKTKKIPPFLQLSKVNLDQVQPFEGGGFADVYIGKWEQKLVALKAIRIFVQDGSE